MKLIIKTDQTCIRCAKGVYIRKRVTATSWEFKCIHCGNTEYRYDQPSVSFNANETVKSAS